MEYSPHPTLFLEEDQEEHHELSARVPTSRGSESPTASPLTRTQSWYYSSMYPGYKARKKEFKELFGSSQNLKFVVDYSCAYHKDILHQGRVYVTTEYCCFYSYIFGWENKLIIPWAEVIAITKEKTALFIPNAIQVKTVSQKYFFASFVDRDSSHMMMLRLWQAVTNSKQLSEEEVDQIIACEYGEGEEEDRIDNDSLESETDQMRTPALAPSPSNQPLAKWMRDCDGKHIIDKTFSRPVSELMRLIYSNDNFYFNFQKERGTTELDIGDWEADQATGDKIRDVSYNMALNNPVGPKKCQVKETQVLRDLSSDVKMFCIDTEADNSGVPYADSFSVITHNCLLELSPSSSRLIAKAEIKFKKELWGFLKDKIETNAWAGIKDYYESLGSSLESYKECEPQQASSSLQQRRGKLPVQESRQWSPASQQTLLVSVVMIVLLLTSVINTVVLYRLSKLPSTEVESEVENLPPPPSLSKLPADPAGWLDLMARQTALHSVQSRFLKQQMLEASRHIAAAERAMANMRETLESWEPYQWLEEEGEDCDNLHHNCHQPEEHLVNTEL